jgi:hypothetical protein
LYINIIMNHKRVCILVALFLILLCRAGEAFVPQTPHLLYMVIQKIKQPVGIETIQTKKIVNYTDTAQPFTIVQERLMYAFPGMLRTQSESQTVSSFSIESQDRFVKVVDGMISLNEKPLLERYTDILLYRDYEAMARQLAGTGVDTGAVGLDRYRGTICYVIGLPEQNQDLFSGLWIEKDTFLPVKYVIVSNGWTVEFLYDRWQQFSKTWYPMQTAVFLDDKLHAVVDVSSVMLKRFESDDRFDVDYVTRVYPAYTGQDKEDTVQDSELDKSISEFENLLE